MLAEPDFAQMQEYILKKLPELLRQNPEIATTIEGMIAHQFPRRDEFARLLEEVTHLWQEVKLLREDSNHRFEQIDKRFEQIDKRFEQIDKRFEQIDKRFDLLHQEVNQLRDEMDRRFELVQKEMDRRFELIEEKMDRRFELIEEKMDRRFELLQKEMDRRFEVLQKEMDRRFEEEKRERLDMKRRLIKVESMMTRMDEKITQFDAWLKVVTGNVGDKKGQDAEQLFALGLSYGLKRTDIKPQTIQLRQMFMDDDGIVFPKKGKYIEVDILAENGQLSVFEVKITAVETDVVTFARKVQLVQHQNPEKPVSGIFISPNAGEEIKQCCAEYDLAFIG